MQSTNDLWFNNQAVAGFQLGSYSDAFPARVGQRALEALHMLAEEYIRSDIYGIYPAEEANEALRLLETGATRGKLLRYSLLSSNLCPKDLHSRKPYFHDCHKRV
ncbi:zinc-binding dehydrogenase [Brevibacillus porteri]|uniref:zinc-binding dehydrogenase n=1 Tax=Brevibacillus porteri TaxID=2126350 RepID=UPI00399D26F5